MTVKAHRYYQFAMCMYKVWRYKNGDDLLERCNDKKDKDQEDENPTMDSLRNTMGSSVDEEEASLLVQKRSSAKNSVSVEADWWKFVDNCMLRAIKNYEKLTITWKG